MRSYVFEPRRVEYFASKNLQVHDVALGSCHTLFLVKSDASMSVYSCGRNEHGQSGHTVRLIPKRDPELIQELGKLGFNILVNIQQIAAGALISYFVNHINDVYYCGANDISDFKDADGTVPIKKFDVIKENQKVIKIESGSVF